MKIPSLLVAVTLLTRPTFAAADLPPVEIPSTAAERIERALETWRSKPYALEVAWHPYAPFGAYMEKGKGPLCSSNPRLAMDDQGIAMQPRGDEFNYNPVLSAQCGLIGYGKFIDSRDPAGLADAIRYADHLIEMQNDEGGFPYNFERKMALRNEFLAPGWVSAMAQGQGMSLLARAYMITSETKYLDAGKKALDLMLRPTSEGGSHVTLAALHPSLAHYSFLEEYPSDPPSYTLNGYGFAMLGLYDWSQIPGADVGQQLAKSAFTDAVKTLEMILPYFDMKEMSSYDLTYITVPGTPPHINASYHGVHIVLLHALYSITGSSILLETRNRWLSYVE